MDSLHTQRLIAMTEVQSSQIHSIGHHAPTLTLAIRFRTKTGRGSLYHYQNVPAEIFGDLSGAASVGSYFAKHIKGHPNDFPSVRVDEAAEDDVGIPA